VLLLALTPELAIAAPYAAPSSSFLQGIQSRHGKNDWWYVTTDSARLLVRIRYIDRQGLSGLSPKRRSDAVPPALEWSASSRIDERHSKFLSRSIAGAVLGAAAGGWLPRLVGIEGTQWFWVGFFTGATVGGWLGGRSGDAIERAQPIYLSTTILAPGGSAPASTPADSVPTASRDSSLAAAAPQGTASGTAAPAIAGGASGTPAAGSVVHDADAAARPTLPVDSVAMTDACRTIRPGLRIRVAADFGIFDGSVENATAKGLHGLRFHGQQANVEAMPGLVTWDRIQRVDRHAAMTGPGAVKGAVIFGALGLLSGVAWNATSPPSSGADSEGSMILLTTACGVAGGALVGAAIGSSGTSWVKLYPR
jgi:hypothetical protein